MQFDYLTNHTSACISMHLYLNSPYTLYALLDHFLCFLWAEAGAAGDSSSASGTANREASL